MSGLVYLFLEASKRNLSTFELSSFLDECIVSKNKSSENSESSPSGKAQERADYIVKQFDLQKPIIRHQVLSKRGFEYGGLWLKDIDWRLDYCVKSTTLENNNELIYTIRMNCGGASGNENVEFTCSIEELEDLYEKMRQALQALQK